MTTKFNHSISCNCKCTSNLHGITKLVFNLKSNNVLTCTESNIALGRKHIAVDRGLYNNTVNCDLTGGKVKRSIISYSCRECNIITCDSSAVLKRNCNIRCRICRIGYSRKYSIVNSRAVVESDIVNVESNYIRSIGFYISTDEGRRTGVGLVRRRHSRHIIVLADINSSIYPTRFRNICICCRVKVGTLTGCSRGEHKVFLLARSYSINRPVCVDI